MNLGTIAFFLLKKTFLKLLFGQRNNYNINKEANFEKLYI